MGVSRLIVHTFSRRQMDQLSSGLRILIDKKLLEEEKLKGAKNLIAKFKRAQIGGSRFSSGEPYAQVYISEAEEKLLRDVEETLWR